MDEKNRHWLVLELSGRHIALPLSLIERVVRAVEMVRLPYAPAVLPGVINVQGHVVPVLDTYMYFDLPTREIKPSDFFLLLQLSGRNLAVLANRVLEVAPQEAFEISDPESHGSNGAYTRIWKNEIVFLIDAAQLTQVQEQYTSSLVATHSVSLGSDAES